MMANGDRQRNLSTHFANIPNETFVQTNAIANRTDSLENRVTVLPSSDQAKPCHKPPLKANKSTVSFEAHI